MKPIRPQFLAITLAVGLACGYVLAGLTGCETGVSGWPKPLSITAEHTITNAVAAATTASSQILPAPWSTEVQTAGGLVLGLLAAWQAWTHSRVTKLVNGNNQTKVS